MEDGIDRYHGVFFISFTLMQQRKNQGLTSFPLQPILRSLKSVNTLAAFAQNNTAFRALTTYGLLNTNRKGPFPAHAAGRCSPQAI